MFPQQWAHTGRRHTGRLRRSVRLETVRGHNLGSLACKPSADGPILRSGRRTAPRSTTGATDRSRPCCIAAVQQHPATFFEQAEAAVGADSPQL